MQPKPNGQKMIKYPIGIHTFEGIRRENYVYVDKTELVYRLKRGGRHYLLCRPRMFGKSLLLSTIQSYFKGEKELFKGLMIDDLEKSWHTHAVLRFDFQDPSLGKEDSLDKLIDTQLSELEKQYGRDESEASPKSIKDRFIGLIERAHQTSQRGVVLLIDNYDSPLLMAMEDRGIMSHYIDTLTEFYSVLPMVLDKIRFSFICGITAIGKSSFLKDYVYSGTGVAKSCNLKSHYKTVKTVKTANNKANEVDASLDGVEGTIKPKGEVSVEDQSVNNNGINSGPDIETDSPLECSVTPELPSYSGVKTPLLPHSDEMMESKAELINDDNSITATNEDSRFAATPSENFIPMDADPTVKVIIDSSDTKDDSVSHLNQTDADSVACPVNIEVKDGKSYSPIGQIDITSTNSNNPNRDTTTNPVRLSIDPRSTDTESSNPISAVTTEHNDKQTMVGMRGSAFIRDISLDSAFTGLCGFSEDEILDNMRSGLERLAEYKESDIQSVMEGFSRRYYGYHFNIKGQGKYNPYDVFNALYQDRIGDYWCSAMKLSGIKDLVISKIMTSEFDMRLLKECKIPKSELERDPFQLDSPIALLYQCGYLTIMGHGPQDKMLYLTLSNKEVREEFLSELLDCYGCFHPQKNNYITAMLEDLQNGFPEIFVVRMKSFFQDPEDAGYCRYYPQTSALKVTNFPLYCQNILYLVFTLLSKDVLESFGQEIGYEINDGNAELIMQFDHSVYIFEFVLDLDINYALRLIQQRHLQAPVIYEDKQIVKVCVSVCSELRNISSWFVEKDESPEYQSEGDQASAFPLFSPHSL